MPYTRTRKKFSLNDKILEINYYIVVFNYSIYVFLMFLLIIITCFSSRIQSCIIEKVPPSKYVYRRFLWSLCLQVILCRFQTRFLMDWFVVTLFYCLKRNLNICNSSSNFLVVRRYVCFSIRLTPSSLRWGTRYLWRQFKSTTSLKVRCHLQSEGFTKKKDNEMAFICTTSFMPVRLWLAPVISFLSNT